VVEAGATTTLLTVGLTVILSKEPDITTPCGYWDYNWLAPSTRPSPTLQSQLYLQTHD